MRDNRSKASFYYYLLLTIQVVGLFGLFVKKVQMELNSGYLTILRFLGKTSLSELSFIDRLSFFREDILIYLVILPVAVFIISYKFGDRLKVISNFLFCSVLALLFYIGLYSLANVGHFLSSGMLMEAVIWGISDPHIIAEYLSLSGVVKLLVILISVILLLFIGRKYQFGSRWLGRFGLAVAIFAAIVSVTGYTSSMQKLPQHNSVLTSMLDVLVDRNQSNNEYRELSDEELIKVFDGMTYLDTSDNTQSLYHGGEAGADILFFILETTPTRCLDFTVEDSSFPAIEQLKKNSFVSSKHFATYPYTRDALFSIFGSQYPTYLNRILKFNVTRDSFGLMTTLKKSGYKNKVYSPAPDMLGYDGSMFLMLGADSIYFNSRTVYQEDIIRERTELNITELLSKNKEIEAGVLKRYKDLLYNDLMTLEKLKSDLIENKTKGKKFISVFLPQVSHAPWLNLYGREDIEERGKDVIKINLEWLEEIVRLLEENNWLSNTMIVVTGDHGVRNKTEDTAFVRGEDIDYAFNVPLLIYAPRAVNEYHELPHTSSHIDITPTVLALLGIEDSSFAMQGVPVWDERLRGRNIFLLAKDYYGIDGYYDNSHYYMYEYLTGMSSRSEDMRFLTNEILPVQEKEKVEKYLQTFYHISEAWFEKRKLVNMPD